jgi:hypothetical protein
LWGEQPVAAQQPQDPFAACVHALLAASPRSELAVALASKTVSP